MSTNPGRILVVDDDGINRIVLMTSLREQGYEVTVAEHGRQALGILYSQPFDVVLLDLLMPEMDGFQVLEHIKKPDCMLHHIPVIIISALDEMEHVVRCIKMGAADYLTKPFDPVLLHARVSASLATKQMHDQEIDYLRQVTYLTSAAAAIEAGSFDARSLAPLVNHSSPLGQLARVFQRMAYEIAAREQHLQHQNQVKSAFISKITHELRSPFVSAGFTVQLLQRYAERQMISDVQDQIQILERELSEGKRMLDSIITFASLASKQVTPNLVETDLAALTREVTAPLEVLAATHAIGLSFDFPPRLPLLQVDQELLGEAIYHLVHNAIKFNHDGGSVRVSCWPRGQQLIFKVDDSGCGMATDRLTTIWEAFDQSADNVRRGIEGLGLGLAIVKSVIDAHGGQVAARSVLDKGSTFGFRLPLSSVDADAL